MADELRLLCDEMLAGLGRWLRLAGYDTEIAGRGRRDRDILEQAHAKQRVLLTRDWRILEIRQAKDRTIVLESDGIDACANELHRRLSLDWTFDPLSRCTLCNARLERADHRLLESLPRRLRALGPTVRVCPHCGRLYWEGSHVRRIRRRLATFASPAARDRTEQDGELDRPDAPL